MTKRFLIFICLIAPVSAQEFRRSNVRPVIHSPNITEASGLAVSTRNPDFLWLINDSGAQPMAHLCTRDGTERGVITIQGVKNIDWEDIASFSLDGVSYILIADTGDNSSKRTDCSLLIIPEPIPPTGAENLTSVIAPLVVLPFQFEDGPRDCEAVAVDATNRKIILLSKRTKPPAVYELPLTLTQPKVPMIARRTGTTNVDAPPLSLVPYGDQPTGMSISADGKAAAVITYYGVFLFSRRSGESWTAAFAKKPLTLAPHLLPQAEGIGFSKDGKTLFTTSEGKNPSLVIYQN